MPKNKQFFIKVNDELIPVTEEIYLVYYRSKRRERYYEHDIKIKEAIRDEAGNITGYRPAKEDSLDRLIAAGEEYYVAGESVEDTALSSVMADKLHAALLLLEEEERALIDTLFFSNSGTGMTERSYAHLSSTPRKTVAYRREQIFEKLKKIIGEN